MSAYAARVVKSAVALPAFQIRDEDRINTVNLGTIIYEDAAEASREFPFLMLPRKKARTLL